MNLLAQIVNIITLKGCQNHYVFVKRKKIQIKPHIEFLIHVEKFVKRKEMTYVNTFRVILNVIQDLVLLAMKWKNELAIVQKNLKK